jgi:hypothetical protein
MVNKAIRQTLQLEVVKLAGSSPVRLWTMSERIHYGGAGPLPSERRDY